MNSYLNGTIVLARANEEIVFSALLINYFSPFFGKKMGY